jgi:hypothetical protein
MRTYNTIVEKYPLLFEGLSKHEPLSLFGFECDIGWYDIIDKACHVLYHEYKRCKQQYEYCKKSLNQFETYVANRRFYDKTTSEEDIQKELSNLMQGYLKRMEEAKERLPKFVQIKEKFGTLCLYTDRGDRLNDSIVDFAEEMSSVICEVCGDSGRTYSMGWHKTLCKKHAIQRYGEEKVNNYENGNK